MIKRTKIKISFATILFYIIVSLMFIQWINPIGCFSYVYTLFLFLLLNYFIDKDKCFCNLKYFHFYLLLALILYSVQKLQMPSYMGLTGPEGSIGTDDCRYFAGVADVNVPYKVYYDFTSFGFCLFIKFIYPFKIIDPINVIILNLIGISFLPSFTGKLAYYFSNDKRVADLSEKLMLLCPFTLATGLIIMRDVWCSSLILISFFYYIKAKYKIFFVSLLLLTWLKFGFVVFILLCILLYHIFRILEGKYGVLKVCILCILLLIFLFLILPYLSLLSGGKLEDGSLFRYSFIEYLQNANENSLLVKIYALPILLRVPALILVFLIIPVLSFDCYTDGIFNVRVFAYSVLSPIYSILLYKYYLLFFFNCKSHSSKIRMLFFIVISLALALGIISLQSRQKVVLFPFIYMAIAYAYYYSRGKYNQIAIVVSLFLFLTQLLLALKN
ncbi:MAG: hypothetical protein BHV75_02255 [Bacteroides oleiciplenus]|nr:MAG: hypothetical protein BHV75_02255 [Bacteroides oleiciplenus]